MADRLVVVGGDAAGMSAASQVRRRQRHLEIVVLEKGQFTSYSACGIPYLVGGEIDELDQLVARTPEEFRERLLIDVRLGHEVTSIDMDSRRVEVVDHQRQRTIHLPFDQLLIATGARPVRPDLPGIDSPWVRGVQTLGDAESLLAPDEQSGCRQVVVVGGGYIGLEMAEAFVAPGRQRHPGRGPATGHAHARSRHGRAGGGGAACATASTCGWGAGRRLSRTGRCITDSGSLRADLAVLGLGVMPNSELADRRRGRARGPQCDRGRPPPRTDVDGVWAAGDCAESFHRVSRRPVHIALGTVANKQGRVAGINLGGGYATLPGRRRHRHHPDLRDRDRPHRPERDRGHRVPGSATSRRRIETTDPRRLPPEDAAR